MAMVAPPGAQRPHGISVHIMVDGAIEVLSAQPDREFLECVSRLTRVCVNMRRESPMRVLHACTLFLGLLSMNCAPPAPANAPAGSSTITLVGHSDLNGNGDGGEGLVVQQRPDGRRLLFLAHEGQRTCFTVVDVTRPAEPVVIAQIPSPAPGVTRCNSLGLTGNTLVVANQTLEKGQKPAGVW